jgi:capsular exopolysaccharide synthesis family protein
MKPKPPSNRAGEVQLVPRSEAPEGEGASNGPAQAYGYDPAEDLGPTGLLEYGRMLLRHRGTLVLTGFLGALLAFLYTLPQTPIYQTAALVEIQPMNPDFLNMGQVNPVEQAEGGWDSSALDTQIKVMQTRTMIERVTDKLRSERPEQNAVQDDQISTWREALNLKEPDAASEWDQALAMAVSSLTVRASGRTRIVQISVDSTDPGLAADFANSLSEEFIDQNLEARWLMTQRTGEWLSGQLEDMRIKLEESEGKLQRYARQSGLLYTSEEGNIAEERLRQLQQALSDAQADRVGKQSRFELASNSAPQTLPDVLNDTSLREYQSNLTDLRRQEAELGTTFKGEHAKVRRVRAQIEALEAALLDERGSIVKRIRNDYEEAARRESLLRQDYETQARIVGEQAESAIQYNILKREVESTREIHDAMLQRVKEASVASALRASNVRVVDPARVPGSPYKPRIVSNALVGLMLGGLCGIAFVIFRERSDRTLQNPGDTSYYLNLRELGVIPAASRKRALKIRYRVRSNQTRLNLEHGRPDKDSSEPSKPSRVELVSWQHKPSMIAESFRATLTSILFSGRNGSRPRVLTITSSSPSEGKTTVACNLAIALAHHNQRVLVIDADMRRPRLHEIFDVAQADGLSDLLMTRRSLVTEPLDACIRHTSIENLVVLPSGSVEQSSTATHLLYSEPMAELLQRFKCEFDMVLIDTPPMLQIPDARILGRLSDAVILVVQAGKTTRDTALAAQQMFDEDGTRVLGSILNRWDPKNTRSGAYGYGYGYGSYESYCRSSSNGATSSGKGA